MVGCAAPGRCCDSSSALSCAPVSVMTTRLLPNGCIVKSWPKVTTQGGAPVHSRSARMPPGFMKAICAPPRPAPRGGELRVGDHAAGAATVVQAGPAEAAGDAADRPVRLRRHDLLVAGDHRRDRRIGPRRCAARRRRARAARRRGARASRGGVRSLTTGRLMLRVAEGTIAAGARIDRDVDHRDAAPVRGALDDGAAADDASVALVGVRREDHRDLRRQRGWRCRRSGRGRRGTRCRSSRRAGRRCRARRLRGRWRRSRARPCARSCARGAH